MCGQAGIAGSITFQSEKVFQNLLIYNSTRGTDSTGAASVKRQPNKDKGVDVVIAKEVGNPFELFYTKRTNASDYSDVTGGQHRLLMGHCRASTRGATSRKNAHPFLFNTIIGTHNGTLDYNTVHKLSGGNKFETDSEALYNEIEGIGIDETIKKLKGYKDPGSNISCPDAYALVWYDAKDNSINFLRNKERPLYFGFDKKKEQIFWSSEFYHLLAGMAPVEKDEKFIHELPVDRHYSWVIPSFGQPFGKAHVVVREGHKEVPFFQSWAQSTTKPNNGVGTTNDVGDDAGKFDRYTGNGYSRWIDKETGFWVRYNFHRKHTVFSHMEHGTYQDTPQAAWDVLPDFEKVNRLRLGEEPSNIKTGYFYDNKANKWAKGPDPELNDSLDDEKTNKALVIKIQQAREDKLRAAIINDVGCLQLYKNSQFAAYYDTKNKKYLLYTYRAGTANPGWERQIVDHIPHQVPFTELDISSRHCFVHKGRKKKKVTSFKGFQGSLLVRETFEKIMDHGCRECSRQPNWGNDVLFLSHEEFLCEYCKTNPDYVRDWKELLADDKKRVVN